MSLFSICENKKIALVASFEMLDKKTPTVLFMMWGGGREHGYCL